MRAYWLVPAVVAAGFIVAFTDQESGVPAWLRARADLRDSQGRVGVLRAETEKLRTEIRSLETDPFALERAIREELELARKGEVIVRFPRDDYPD
ncbi:MAG: septum formation initiator family protein [Deltaproteobacteria bacterium]|nr:septum formation initiator family protein [Deltaproteobacteria bacterium]